MKTSIIVSTIVVLAVLLTAYAGSILAIAKRHKIDLATAIDKAQTEIPVLTSLINLLEAALPGPAKPIATTLGDMIVKAITTSEQLKNASLLTPESRKATAMSLITAALKAQGIVPDDKTTAAISDAVDLGARVLIPHTVNTDTSAAAAAGAAQA